MAHFSTVLENILGSFKVNDVVSIKTIALKRHFVNIRRTFVLTTFQLPLLHIMWFYVVIISRYSRTNFYNPKPKHK